MLYIQISGQPLICMDPFRNIPLASPVDPATEERLRASLAFLTGQGGPPTPDVLEAFRRGRRSRKLISIRIDVWMLDLTKAVAKRHRMGYQHVVRMWIEQGLRRSVEGARKKARS